MSNQEYSPVSVGNKKAATMIALMVFALAFLAYANTLTGDFIWDDEYLILNNSQIKSFTHLGDVFTTYAGYGSGNVNNFYRPVQEISNMVDFSLWGENPLGFHLTNIILHALVAVMVFIFLTFLAGDILTASIASLLYAVHPVHTEAVAYIAGRADPLCAFFMLSSLVLFIKASRTMDSGRKGASLYIASLLLFVVSLLSKETAIIMPLIVFLYIFFFLRRKDAYRKIRFSWIPYVFITGIYVFLRTTVLNFSGAVPESVFTNIPIMYRILTFLRSIGIYLRLLLVPLDLHMERSMSITGSIFEVSAIIAVIAAGFIAWLVMYTYRRNRLAAFSICWFFVCLLPFSNVIPLNSFLAEHWIYLASVGPFLLAAIGIVHVYNNLIPPRIKIIFIPLIGIIIGIFAGLTVRRNTEWSDEIVFYKNTLKYNPANTRVYLNLGNAYYERGELEGAIDEYLNVIEIDNNYAVAYGNIGTASLRLGDKRMAEKHLRKAIELREHYPIAYYNLGLLKFEEAKYKESEENFKKAISQMPQLYQAWGMLGRSLLEQGKKEEAKEAFSESLRILPDQDDVRDLMLRIDG